MTRPLERIGGTAHVLGIRFRPGGARSLLGRRDLRAIRNSQAPISLWGDERAPQEADIVAALESHLLVASRRLGAYERGGTELARRCFATNLPIAKLAEEVGMSRQHLRRRVVDASGLAPKVLARVGRARRLRELLDGGANAGAAAALSAGYFDQSHMVNEFGALMGVSPGAYAARSS